MGAQVPAKEAKLFEVRVLVNDVQEPMNRKISSIISSLSNKLYKPLGTRLTSLRCAISSNRGKISSSLKSLQGHDVLSGRLRNAQSMLRDCFREVLKDAHPQLRVKHTFSLASCSCL